MNWTKEHRANHRAAMQKVGRRIKSKNKASGLDSIKSKRSPKINARSAAALKTFTTYLDNKSVVTGNLKCVQMLVDTTVNSLNDLNITELKLLIENKPEFAVTLRNLRDVSNTVASLVENKA